MTVQEVKEATVTAAQLLSNAGAKIATKKKEGGNPHKSELVLHALLAPDGWLTDSIFNAAQTLIKSTERLVIKQFAVSEKEKCIPTQLSHMELNVVRYTADYVCRTVKSDVAKTKRKDKEELLLCLMEMSGDEGNEDRETEDWTNARDRGGLWHISDIGI